MGAHKLPQWKMGFCLEFLSLWLDDDFYIIWRSQDLQADWFLKEYEKEKSRRVRVALAPKNGPRETGSSAAVFC